MSRAIVLLLVLLAAVANAAPHGSHPLKQLKLKSEKASTLTEASIIDVPDCVLPSEFDKLVVPFTHPRYASPNACVPGATLPRGQRCFVTCSNGGMGNRKKRDGSWAVARPAFAFVCPVKSGGVVLPLLDPKVDCLQAFPVGPEPEPIPAPAPAPTPEPSPSPSPAGVEPAPAPAPAPVEDPSNKILGGGWTLVRHVPAGLSWHPAIDQLKGTETYGPYDPKAFTSDFAFSTRFDTTKFNQFLFATGDFEKWLVADREEVESFGSNFPANIVASSKSASPSKALWYHRVGVLEDPWISTIDHFTAIGQGEILYGENSFGSTHAAAVLPQHKGANVFVRWVDRPIPADPCDKILGGGWQLVRHVPAGPTWHPTADHLQGTAEYGTFDKTGFTSRNAFSKKFADVDFDQFLFATGDCNKWMVVNKIEVARHGSNFLGNIVASHSSDKAYQARWYNRYGVNEDPWISTEDHLSAIGKGNILYGENSFGGTHAGAVLPSHQGANVYIRHIGLPETSSCESVLGGGWTLVRHVPDGNAWHPTTDHLAGTASYGEYNAAGYLDAKAFSLKFDTADYNQFLFATGDCEKWMVVAKSEVQRQGSDFPANIIASSLKPDGPSQAKWFNRPWAPEDPWISIVDHWTAIGSGDIMYGENSFGGPHASNVLPLHVGANVFIRKVE